MKIYIFTHTSEKQRLWNRDTVTALTLGKKVLGPNIRTATWSSLFARNFSRESWSTSRDSANDGGQFENEGASISNQGSIITREGKRTYTNRSSLALSRSLIISIRNAWRAASNLSRQWSNYFLPCNDNSITRSLYIKRRIWSIVPRYNGYYGMRGNASA